VTEFERAATVELVKRLVAIDSVNPALVPGAAGEEELANFVAERMKAAGLEAHLQETAPGRPNAIGRLVGTGGGRTLMLNAHMDTVGLGGISDPLTLRVEGDRAFGRGAYDMKGSLASIILAVERLAEGPKLSGDVVVTAVADEEHGSLGTARAVAELTADMAVVAEPTNLEVCVAHKGFAWIEIETEGRAAHGSKPDQGVDAIAMMGEVLAQLNGLSGRLSDGTPHPLLGHGSLHSSLIQGGQELSSYPARCLLQVERRTLPGDTADLVAGEAADFLRAATERTPQFRGSARVFFWRDAFEVDPKSQVVVDMMRAARTVLGREPELVGATWWMDSALTAAAGIPTVVFGVTGDGAHSDDEWVSLSSIETCAQVFIELARNTCA
jgi:acetylornithine deacetylase